MALETQPLATPVSHRNDLLKIIALATMFIDHLGMLYFPGEMMYRTIGRIAFPIFAYQIAIGFQKTSSRKKYGSRLFIFACVSQIPYLWFNPEVTFYFGGLNIMFTFFFALCALQCYEMGSAACASLKTKLEPTALLKTVGYWLLSILIIISPEITRMKYGHGTEYGMSGILFVFLFYFLSKRKLSLLAGYIGLSAFSVYYSTARGYYASAPSIMSFFEAFISFKMIFRYIFNDNDSIWTLSGVFFQSRSVMAVPIIWLGNYIDQLGTMNIRLNKYVGYWFYPVHIAALLLIKVFLF